MNGGKNMKIDSMDAQIAYVQSSGQSQHPTPQQSQSAGAENLSPPVQSNMGDVAERNDSSNVVSNKHISDLTPMEIDNLSLPEKTIIEAIEKANRAALGRNTSCRFSIHEATKRISVKILDKDTNEVIREIPPEKVLDMVAKMWEMSGLFVDERR
jgi:flagellar protein FlaG